MEEKNKKLTVGKLKEIIKDLPDNMECKLWSDTGIDQCAYDDNSEAVLENSWVHKDKLIIYGNWR